MMTYPSKVMQVDGLLYFYSVSQNQINKKCRGGQKVEIEVPLVCFSVAATTNPPALHVIGDKCNESGQHILTVLTLNSVDFTHQFDESRVPSLHFNTRIGCTISVGAGSRLFVMVAIADEGCFSLWCIDKNELPSQWSRVGKCPHSVRYYLNHQLLKYDDHLLYVNGRDVAIWFL